MLDAVVSINFFSSFPLLDKYMKKISDPKNFRETPHENGYINNQAFLLSLTIFHKKYRVKKSRKNREIFDKNRRKVDFMICKSILTIYKTILCRSFGE